MKVKKSEVIAMFVALGFAQASEWTDERLQKKIAAVGKYKEVPGENKDALETLTKLQAAVEDEEDVEIDNDVEAAPKQEESADKEKPAKKEKKEKKEKKGKPDSFKGAGGEGKPGIIKSIVDMVLKATEKNPITSKQVLENLKTLFPDRDAEKMAKTVAMTKHNCTEHGMVLNGNAREGWWATGEWGKKVKKAKPKKVVTDAQDE